MNDLDQLEAALGQRGPDGSLDTFRARLRECCDVSAVRKFLSYEDYEVGRAAFDRLHELVRPHADLWLEYSLWLYFHGEDAVALEWFDKARKVDPYRYEVLVVDVWYSFGGDPESMRAKVDVLLRHFPQDAWAADLSAQLKNRGEVRDMALPSLRLDWA